MFDTILHYRLEHKFQYFVFAYAVGKGTFVAYRIGEPDFFYFEKVLDNFGFLFYIYKFIAFMKAQSEKFGKVDDGLFNFRLFFIFANHAMASRVL